MSPSLRFYKFTSKFFSFKKILFFSKLLKHNSGKNNSGTTVLRGRVVPKKNLNININYSRSSLGIKQFFCSYTFNKKNKPFLMLLKNKLGSIQYVTAPDVFLNRRGVKSVLFFSQRLKLKLLGNFLILKYFKANDVFFNLTNTKFSLLKIATAGGTYLKILYFSSCKNFLFIKLPSNKKIRVPSNYYAVLGKNSNKFVKKEVIGAAGRNIKIGFKSKVRGVAMNPVDHPHGGRTKTNSPEVSP